MTPTAEVLRTRLSEPPRLHQGLDGWVHHGIGWWRRHRLARRDFAGEARRLSAAHAALAGLSETELDAEIARHRVQVRRHRRACTQFAFQALPAVAEVARRELKLDPYPEQFRGAIALLEGAIAEMATGEGKTLTIALAAAPLGWTQLPVHVMTANDYLAGRDAKNLSRFYQRCGLEVRAVGAQMHGPARAEAHAAEVVYTTAKELLADFLRDRLILGPWQEATQRIARSRFRQTLPSSRRLVLRGLHHAIVDEADSAMIDEAVTPLIISRQVDNQAMVDAVLAARDLASILREGDDFTTDPVRRDIQLTARGEKAVAEEAATHSFLLLGNPVWCREMVETALRAERFYLRDKHYVVKDGAVIIVDEFTGRLMPGRQWKQGLHQAVEAKEGLVVNQPTESIAQLSFQTFFRFFPHLSGITGTARECARELWAVHHKPFVSIPRHRPNRARQEPPRAFATAEAKWDAVIAAIRTAHESRRPVLVGTRSIAASESLARQLELRLIPFRLLNAVRNDGEAEIIERAGQRGAITLATNLAGRGTDIHLGAGMGELGGLLVIATEPHRSSRVDRQLFGRAARQGEPGGGRLFFSCDDELLVDFLPAAVRWTIRQFLASRLVGSQWLAIRACRWAQRRAERAAFRQRLAVLRQDRWVQENLTAGRSDFGF